MSINWKKKKYRRNNNDEIGQLQPQSVLKRVVRPSVRGSMVALPEPHMGNYLVLWHNWDWEFASHAYICIYTHTFTHSLIHSLSLSLSLSWHPQTAITIDLRVHYLLDQPYGRGSGWGILAKSFHWIACNQHWLASKVPKPKHQRTDCMWMWNEHIK